MEKVCASAAPRRESVSVGRVQKETPARDELTDREKINYLENRLAKANNTIGTLKGQLAERDATIKVLKKELEKARMGAVNSLKKQAERTKLAERDYLRERGEPPWGPEVQKLHDTLKIHGAASSNPVQTAGSFLEALERISDYFGTKSIENKDETGVKNTQIPDPEKQPEKQVNGRRMNGLIRCKDHGVTGRARTMKRWHKDCSLEG
jgi:hypothetical protein